MGSGYGVARAIEELIARGHPVEKVWEYTPRQLAGFVELGYRRRMAEHLELFAIMQCAAQGDARAAKKLTAALKDESQ